MDAFFDPFLKINWYVHDSTDLEPEKFTVGYILRYAKRPPLAECRISQYGQIEGKEGTWVTFTYHQVKERILTFKIMAQIPMFGYLEILRLFANFGSVQALF